MNLNSIFSGLVDRDSGETRVNQCMPHSSFWFVHFKWWSATGIDAAIWVCQKQFYDPEQRQTLEELVRSQTSVQWSEWLFKLFSLGHPAILAQLQTGHDNIWVTDVAIAQFQRSGAFPKLFQGNLYPNIAGITIKKVAGDDRPGIKSDDLVLDIIITVCPSSKDTPSPVLHRQQIPHWTREQIAVVGRYTTGPLITHWTKI